MLPLCAWQSELGLGMSTTERAALQAEDSVQAGLLAAWSYFLQRLCGQGARIERPCFLFPYVKDHVGHSFA